MPLLQKGIEPYCKESNPTAPTPKLQLTPPQPYHNKKESNPTLSVEPKEYEKELKNYFLVVKNHRNKSGERGLNLNWSSQRGDSTAYNTLSKV